MLLLKVVEARVELCLLKDGAADVALDEVFKKLPQQVNIAV